MQRPPDKVSFKEDDDDDDDDDYNRDVIKTMLEVALE